MTFYPYFMCKIILIILSFTLIQQITSLTELQSEISTELQRQSSCTSSLDEPKYAWSFWHQGEDQMPDFMKLNVQTWRSKLGEEWKITVLNEQQDSKNFYLNFIDLEELPKAFDSMDKKKKRDMVRLALLCRYGGVWIDASVILVKPISQWVKFSGSQPEHISGFYLSKFGSEKFNYKDLFSSWFIAANKNSPFIHKWYEVVCEYYSEPKRGPLQKHEMFKNLDLSNFQRHGKDFRNYLTIHVSLRKLIEENSDMLKYYFENATIQEAENTAYIIPNITSWNGNYVYNLMQEASHEVEGKDLLTEILKQPLLKFNSGLYKKIIKLSKEQLLNQNTIFGKLYYELVFGDL
eukprot:TRINITY_DN19102_c0_g2_i1.p1 TRINITY_DN19102_c0_g2~~TRINITY_DN19102_c0_g2_i1.p1  ORF type:complete len:369 (-),score=38.80 TRINITY_DN19102_c0_g2_i1:983-2029(-)